MRRGLNCDDHSPEFTVPGFTLPDITMEDAYRVLEALGPMPAEALSAMVDYGLSDGEISQYFKLPDQVITTLREHWEITSID